MPTGSQSIAGQPGRYNSALPTLNNGQGAALAVDINGRVILSSSSGGTATIADGGTAPLTSMMVGGEYLSSAPILTNSQSNTLLLDINANLKTTLATGIAGEDLSNDVLKVEQRYTNTRCTADTLVKSGVGQLHAIVVSQPASTTPTAGVLTVYDNTAESGTVLFSHYFPASAVTTPVTIPLNCAFTVGCYVGFDGTLAALAFNIEYR